LIHKVNRPAYLSLVAQPKGAENDPGSSQGSGNTYEQAPSKQDPKDPKDQDSTSQNELPTKSATLATAEQIGMTAVVKDFLEQKRSEAPVNPGLSSRYTLDAQPAKGLLLNKKIG